MVDNNEIYENAETILINEVNLGHIDVVKEILKIDDVAVNKFDSSDLTALMHAAMLGDLEIVVELLKYKSIDVDVTNFEFQTALDLALEFGHEIVAYYIKYRQGHTALELEEQYEKEKYFNIFDLKNVDEDEEFINSFNLEEIRKISFQKTKR